MELVDIGFNFTHESFRKDEAALLARAVQAGVTTLIVTAASLEDSHQALALCERYSRHLFATAGVHPHLAREWGPDTQTGLKALTCNPKLKALGEMGLDYHRDYSPRARQRAAFEAQLELACELRLPVFLHERDAHEDFVCILARYRAQLTRVVVHCFTGSRQDLEAYVALDCHIGVTGWVCDERRGRHLHDLMGLIPPDRLMVETDAPYLLPRDLKFKPASRRNEPMYLPHIVNRIASLRGETPENLARTTTTTARTFYNIG